jgi:hypothetical protein
MGDMCTCVGPPDFIVQGSFTVLIQGQPAARMGDMTAHGGSIVTGFPTVLIGMSPGGASGPSVVAPLAPGQGAPADDQGDHESCFECRQRLAEAAQQSNDPAVKQAGEDMDRLNHDYEHAKLAQHAYSDGPPPEGWTEITDKKELAKMGIVNDPNSDFRARAYKPDPNVFGDDMKTTVAFRGTQSGEDWKNNLQQGVGMKSDYYKKAVGIGNAARANNADVEFTGHSLGGGLASAAASAGGKDATTFNSAGLNSGTVDKYTDKKNQGPRRNPDVNAYRIENELLTGLQEQGWKGTLAAAAAGFLKGGPWGALIGAGAKIGASAIAPDAIGDKYDLPGSGNPLSRHGQDQVIKALDDQIRATEEQLENATGIECDC